MALTISGSEPSSTRPWTPRASLRGPVGDFPEEQYPTAKVTFGWIKMPAAVAPDTRDDGTLLYQQDGGSFAGGSFRTAPPYSQSSMSGSDARTDAITALTGTQTVWLVVWDSTAGSSAPVLAAVKVAEA